MEPGSGYCSLQGIGVSAIRNNNAPGPDDIPADTLKDVVGSQLLLLNMFITFLEARMSKKEAL